MDDLSLSADAFGDPFALERLPLPRPAIGYAVQQLDTDLLLDRESNRLMPVRSPQLQPTFASFADAHAGAGRWLASQRTDPASHALAIVPIGYDPLLERHILIYGVLTSRP